QVLNGVFVNAGGTTEIAHAFQIQSFGRLRCSGGIVRQSSAGVTIGSTVANAILDDGTWELAGPSNVNGTGSFVLKGGTLLKTGSGTANISAPMSFGAQAAPVNVRVEGGTLKIGNLASNPLALVKWSIGQGAEVDLGGQVFTMGQDPLNPYSIIDEIDGVVGLGVGRLPAPRLLCGTLVNGGRIRPGGTDGTGELVIEGDLAMQPQGIVSVSLAGTDPGVSHDLLSIEGSTALAGTLRIRVSDGFSPRPGQQFTVITSTGPIAGAFDAVVGDGAWSAAVVGNTVVATCEAAPTCPADLAANDGTIGGADLGVLLGSWGFAPSSPADLDGDDFVGGSDLGLLLAAWGRCGR
ncbi:MAG: hypothetical protein KDA22_04765, partial [Phycisphaerales bacterium]|nr:hypothetical protein [Phycisphaerales bacterium]